MIWLALLFALALIVGREVYRWRRNRRWDRQARGDE